MKNSPDLIKDISTPTSNSCMFTFIFYDVLKSGNLWMFLLYKKRGFWCKNFRISASNLPNLDILILVLKLKECDKYGKAKSIQVEILST
jgi:hypothetical protein